MGLPPIMSAVFHIPIFIRHFFYQTELKKITKRQFETSEVMRILNIRHIISK
jgi:hypothetical protein